MTVPQQTTAQPDILEVIGDLSSDEVFTPPRVANAVLDLLPAGVWSDPELRWLDPGAKTGVFLREATRRLMVGLADAITDEQERLDHILNNMVFGIAVTELTALMSRRTLYCSKDATGPHSATRMSTPAGHVWFDRVEHPYDRNGRCPECAASKDQMERQNNENHAYGFIHAAGREAIEKEFEMKFDVVIGNPPYQMTGGGGGTNDTPLYNLFVDQAKALNPRYITMVIPSRWMGGGRGLDEFRAHMLGDARNRVIVDHENAKDLFPAVGINGGVCYFLWDRDNPGPCATTFKRNGVTVGPVERSLDEFDVLVRDTRALTILRKVQAADETSFSTLLSGDTPFGLPTNYSGYKKNAKPVNGELLVYANASQQRVQGSMRRDLVTKNIHLIDTWKVLISKAGSGRERETTGVDLVLSPPLVAAPGSVCTQTYIVAGPLGSKAEAESLDSYLRTRFLRFLVSLRKVSQDALRGVYTWVPLQTWDRTWTDEELYAKYGITEDEQAFIAERIREMVA
jgi:site-specific DNA-methyltransferase (adenine-specific)